LLKRKTLIGDIPAIVWGESSKSLLIAVHGKYSHKEDQVMNILAEQMSEKGYRMISFDLPEHGERSEKEDYPMSNENVISDLKTVLEFAKDLSDDISLFACSLGAYFCLKAYDDFVFKQVLFLSPVVNMLSLISGMMKSEAITEEELKKRQIIQTSFGEKLEWDCYSRVKNNPVSHWDSRTSILYGELDAVISRNDVESFCKEFSADLVVLNGSEHYFHTEAQFDFFRKWLKEVVI